LYAAWSETGLAVRKRVRQGGRRALADDAHLARPPAPVVAAAPIRDVLAMRFELVTVPAGAFAMGSDEGQPDERPVHEVELGGFALAVHPVTNAGYGRFVQATGCAPPPFSGDERFAHPEQPVVGVSWFDAAAYCAWLAVVTGRACRLPTEAEREKAALGGRAGLRYPWGDDAGPQAGPLERPPLVGRDRPNGHGLHNMGDLVHEWCSDWYDARYYARSPRCDPRGPDSGVRRVSRGGSWRHRVCTSRCSARSSLPPDQVYADYGFRVAVG
jgi:formylglycine-generating enzyme required for sulfatase activity